MEEVRIHVTPEKLEPLVHETCTFRSAHDFRVTPKDLEKAYQELNETDDKRKSAVEKFRDKISDDQDLAYRTDEDYLLRYLRYTKFNVDKAYKILRRFYTFRDKNPHVFSLSNVERSLNTRFITYLPYADEEGCVVFWLNFRNLDLDESNQWELASAYNVFADILTVNPNVQINGVKGIWDMRGVTMRQVALVFKPTTLIFLLSMLQEIYPWRLKRIVVTHINPVLQGIYNASKYLLKKKFRDRFVLIGSDMNELHKYYNPVILPKEYGGSLEESECYDFRHIMENMNYFEYERTFGPRKDVSCS